MIAPLSGYQKAASQAIAKAQLALSIGKFARQLTEAFSVAFAKLAEIVHQFCTAFVQLVERLCPLREDRAVEGRALLNRHRRRRC